MTVDLGIVLGGILGLLALLADWFINLRPHDNRKD